MSVKKKYLSAWGVPSKPYYVLIETAGQCDMHDEEKLKTLFNAMKDKGLILDGQIGPLNYDDPTFVEVGRGLQAGQVRGVGWVV